MYSPVIAQSINVVISLLRLQTALVKKGELNALALKNSTIPDRQSIF